VLILPVVPFIGLHLAGLFEAVVPEGSGV